jgi:hypothetical protein
MSYSVWGAFAETSWWIYLVFIWLGIIAFQASKPHVISFKAAIIYPSLMIVLLFSLMPFALKLDPYKIFLMLAAILPGLLLGWLQFHFRKIKAVKQTAQFYIPGSWGTFILLIALVALKFYYYNYAIHFDLSLLHEEQPAAFIALLCGLSVGLQTARSLCLYRCLKTGPYK